MPDPAKKVAPVIGVDDFAIRRSRRYATIIIDAVTHCRIDVLPDRKTQTLAAWLGEHPQVKVVCRDGSAAYAEAITQALPEARQVGDRWHLWHNLAEAVLKEVAAHSACWGKNGPPRVTHVQEQTTLARWHDVHDLLDKGVGLLEIARRLQLSLNTVKRYGRASKPERLKRVPKYRPTLVDPYRDYLRKRRAEEPSVPVTHLFAEIKELGYQGSHNLLVRYINQGRVEADRPATSPRRLARLLLTDPARLSDKQRELLDELSTACPEMIDLTSHIATFAQLLTPQDDNAQRLDEWITAVHAADLPHLRAFTRGLQLDRSAVVAGLTLPYNNGPTEGTVTKIKYLKRQMYGRASFPLLRKRILHS
jgi:transposase/putative ubiquitin-RnfH superfamily antitoxin RatB of RatAB toxin-antitoxin module